MSMTRSAIFNGLDLSSLTGVSITGIDYNDMPARTVAAYPLARTDGSKQIAAFFNNRVVQIFGLINDSGGQGAFEADRATLMQSLVGQDLPLDIIIGSVQQRFFATLTSLIFTDATGSANQNNSDTNAGLGIFTITFQCSSPFGIDPNLQNGLTTTVISASPSTQNLATIAGTYKTAPYISVYITSGTGLGVAANFVQLTNPVTGKYILITRAFAVGELLVVDVYNKKVTVNNVAVDFSGNLDLFWDIGAGGQITYTDNLSARSIKLTLQYFARYL